MSDKDKDTVKELIEYNRAKLQEIYGYCGVALSDDFAMLNSGEGNIVIKIYTNT